MRNRLPFRCIQVCVVALCLMNFPANAADIVDPGMLDSMRNSVCFSESFENAAVDKNSKLVEGIVGKAYATTANYTRDVEKILPQGSGSISWWARYNFDSSKGYNVMSLDGSGNLSLNYWGDGADDIRNKQTGHFLSSLFTPRMVRYEGGGGIAPKTWHNFIVTWEGDEMTFYLNGVHCDTAKGTQPFSSLGARTLSLGGSKANGETVLDELRIYNRALTPAEARAYVVAFNQGGSVKDMAARAPDQPASRDTLGLRAAYRVSDHAVQVYGDMKILGEQKVDAHLKIAGEKGGLISEETYPGADPREMFYASIPVNKPLADGFYRVELEAGGKKVAANFERHKEEWENNTIGVTDKAIPPWTPIALDKDGRKVACWGREYSFGELGLPEKILSTQPEPSHGEATRELLAQPVRLRIEGAAGPLKVAGQRPKLVQRSEGYVDVAATGEAGALKIAITGTLEFDGFYKFKVRVEPTQPVEVRSLRLEVALPDKLARLFNASGEQMRANKAFLDLEGLPDGLLWRSTEGVTINDGKGQKCVSARRENNVGNFYPHLWLGDDDRGIAFMGDSTRGWVVDEDKPCQDLVREKGQTVLRLHLVNKTVTLREPVEATLSLQATPIKPRPPGGTWKKGGDYGWYYFDEPVLFPDCFEPEKSKKAGNHPPVDETGKRVSSWWRYFCLCTHRMPITDPEYGDMIRRNEDEWGMGLHVPSHRDFLLWAYKEWHDRLGMSGVYYDNTMPVSTTSLGSGMGWRDAQGNLHGSFDMFGKREFLKRVHTYFIEQGPAPVMKAHISDAPVVGYLGFADSWMDGENDGYPTAEMRVRQQKEGEAIWDFVDRWYNKTGLTNLRVTLGRQWGPTPKYLYVWRKDPTFAMLAMFDVDTLLWRMNGIKDDFGVAQPDVKPIPYWDDRKPIVPAAAAPDVFVTTWQRPGRARVLVSNLGQEALTLDLRVDRALLDLPKVFVALDEQTHDPIELSSGGMLKRVMVNAHNYRLILLGAPGDFAATPGAAIKLAPSKRIEGLCDDLSKISSAWKFEGRCPENQVESWGGMLRILGPEGASLTRAFGEDNCSVMVKMRVQGGFWDAAPALKLLWKNASVCMQAGGMYPAPDGPKIAFLAMSGGKQVGRAAGPEAPTATWLKITLGKETITFSFSTDGQSWTPLGQMPRKGFEGAPATLQLGTPADAKGRGDGMVFLSNLVTGRDE